jgi:hypothetical protein
LQAIIDELATTLQEIQPEKHGKFLSAIYSRLQSTQSNTPTRTLTAPIQAWMLSQDDIQLNPFVPPADEQRVTPEQMVIPDAIDQRVPTNDNTLWWITDAPSIIMATNPTKQRILKLTKQTHSRHTRKNVPGGVPIITPSAPWQFIPLPPPSPVIAPPRRSPQTATPVLGSPPGATQLPWVCLQPSWLGMQNNNIIIQEAINFVLECVWAHSPVAFTPNNLRQPSPSLNMSLHQIAMPLIQPTTGKTISSYKRLMNDPAMSEIWQTAFGKDFGGMAQGDKKTGQKGTNLIFGMTQDEIQRTPTTQTVTYAQVVINFWPQKLDPHCIHITAGGNLINYPGKLSTHAADLTTSNLM